MCLFISWHIPSWKACKAWSKGSARGGWGVVVASFSGKGSMGLGDAGCSKLEAGWWRWLILDFKEDILMGIWRASLLLFG